MSGLKQLSSYHRSTMITPWWTSPQIFLCVVKNSWKRNFADFVDLQKKKQVWSETSKRNLLGSF